MLRVLSCNFEAAMFNLEDDTFSLRKIVCLSNGKWLSYGVLFVVLSNILTSLSPFFEAPCVSCTLTRTLLDAGGCSSSGIVFNSFKAGSPRIPRSPKAQRLGDPPSRDIFGRSLVSPTPSDPGSSSNPQPLSGVDGDIKQAFGDRETGRNLRDDLLLAADNVTSAMSSLVRELNSEDEDLMEDDAQFSNGSVHDTDLDALEQQVNQIRESLGVQEAESNSSDLPNGDFIMTEPSAKVISHGLDRGSRPLKLRAPRGAASEGDTDTDDDDSHTRAGDFKGSSRTQMTDDESYIQTDDDEGTLRTDDEDMEWQESMKRLANR